MAGNVFDERYSFTEIDNPDFIAIAKAYNIDGTLVTKREDLDAAIRDMLKMTSLFAGSQCREKGMVYPMIPAGASVTDVLLGDE